MMTRWLLPGITVVIFATLLAACVPLGSILLARTVVARPARTIILTALENKDAATGEPQPFLSALQNKVDRTAASTFCAGVYEGEISGQPVVVVTTGTGGDKAGPCMQELLSVYSANNVTGPLLDPSKRQAHTP